MCRQASPAGHWPGLSADETGIGSRVVRMRSMLTTIAGILLVLFALQDSFEALVLPRRVTRQWRVSRVYYRTAWRVWRRAAKLIWGPRLRESFLSVFGPLSLFGLFFCWAAMLMLGFVLINWGQQTLGNTPNRRFADYLYMSGETFFTLGYGDITPATYTGKVLSVLEAGTGFGFMAIVIGYLPVLYQAFSRREQTIALLDARAGSPPTASELIRRSGAPADHSEAERFLIEWEVWAADLLESHLSFPVLSFYRSQHGNQSWLAALALVLDTSSVLLATGSARSQRRAQLTFAMARHACVDLCLVFWLPPKEPSRERLTDEELAKLLESATRKGGDHGASAQHIRSLQPLYEPFLASLSDYMLMQLPRFYPNREKADNWQSSAWTERAPAITELPAASERDEHFG